MASSPRAKKQSPQLLSIDSTDGERHIQIAFRGALGVKRKAIFAANDDVQTALSRWQKSGQLGPSDRAILNDYTIEGWANGEPKEAQDPTKIAAGNAKRRGQKSIQRLKASAKPPAISPKEARLAADAKALAAHQDEYRSYWVIVAIVTVLSLSLLGLT